MFCTKGFKSHFKDDDLFCVQHFTTTWALYSILISYYIFITICAVIAHIAYVQCELLEYSDIENITLFPHSVAMKSVSHLWHYRQPGYIVYAWNANAQADVRAHVPSVPSVALSHDWDRGTEWNMLVKSNCRRRRHHFLCSYIKKKWHWWQILRTIDLYRLFCKTLGQWASCKAHIPPLFLAIFKPPF